jgi:chromosome segregation ATPase
MEDNTPTTYDELFEYKKLNAKLEDALEQKDTELTSMTNLYKELKSLNERSRRECDDLNAKLIKSYTERNLLEKKYEAALEQERANLSKQSEIYKDKILKLSSYDPQNMKTKIENEIDLKYRHILNQKQLELDSLTQTVSDIKRNYDLLQTEYETFKSDALKEQSAQRALHQNEISDLLHKIEIQNEKVINNIDKETFRELKNELDASRKHVSDLTNELDVLRNEKEKITIERNELKLTNISEIDKEKFNNKHLQSENEKQSAMILQLQNENDLLKQKLNDKSIQVNDLIRDKSDLVKQTHEYENDFQMFKSEIIALRNKLENQDRELADNIQQTHNEHKERLYKEIADKENYQQQIQDLTNQLKDLRVSFKNYHDEKDNELKNLERDYVILQEEKRIMLQQHEKLINDVKTLQSNYEIKAEQAEQYEKEYLHMQTQYRNMNEQMKELNKKISELETQNTKKDKEVNVLRNKIDGMKYTTDDRAYADLMKKYKEVLEKKKYYKKQCKITNNNILAIMNKVTPEQKREIEEMAGGLNALLNPAASQSQSEA